MNHKEKNHKENKLYMIGNAHIDPVWLWQWQEGFQETKATFRSALDRMKEYPDFVFTNSSAASYEWIENNDPAMFEEIRERVKEGRWVIVGGWWVQPDCNIPCGESYVRHGLYGQRYFYEKFGVMARTGYNVDSFGHNAMLPQILKKCGMDNYVFMRPGRHEKGLSNHTFVWRSMDGSEVTAFRLPFEYTWNKDIHLHIRRCADEIKDQPGSIMCFYGVGNHGGGPTKMNIETIKELNLDPSYPTLIMASPDDYFRDVKKAGTVLPVVEGELLHHASGCYSAHSEIKALNRKAENRLLMAEKLSVMAHTLMGQPYPFEKYARAWKDVLFNQFHDIMAGTSIESACIDAREAYGSSLHAGAVNMNYAVQALSWNINIPMEQDMKPIVVFNPNAFPGKFEVELESSAIKEDMMLIDDENQPIPFQLVQSEAACNGRCRLCFIADLPSLGYRTYRLVKKEAALNFPDVRCDGLSMENDLFRIEFDENSGAIRSFMLKHEGFGCYDENSQQNGSEIFMGPAAVPVVIEDRSDTWSHAIRQFNKVVGHFQAKKVYLLEKGPVKAVMRVISEYGRSALVQDFTVYAQLDYVLVKTTVDWHEQFRMLKLEFPMNLNYLRGSYEIPYGFIQREPDGEEYPMHSWMDFEGAIPKSSVPVWGLSILNDGKTSYDVSHKTVRLTVLRSPIFAHHEPFVPEEGKSYTFQDQGVQHFNYALYPHTKSWEQNQTIRRAQGINQKPIALFETYHEGRLPQKGSFLEISEPNILAGAIKLAEDGSGDIILRLYETVNKKTDVTLKFPFSDKEFCTSLAPCEIKTLRIVLKDEGKCTEVNMLEL